MSCDFSMVIIDNNDRKHDKTCRPENIPGDILFNYFILFLTTSTALFHVMLICSLEHGSREFINLFRPDWQKWL